jgi:hypothetical protein
MFKPAVFYALSLAVLTGITALNMTEAKATENSVFADEFGGGGFRNNTHPSLGPTDKERSEAEIASSIEPAAGIVKMDEDGSDESAITDEESDEDEDGPSQELPVTKAQ